MDFSIYETTEAEALQKYIGKGLCSVGQGDVDSGLCKFLEHECRLKETDERNAVELFVHWRTRHQFQDPLLFCMTGVYTELDDWFADMGAWNLFIGAVLLLLI